MMQVSRWHNSRVYIGENAYHWFIVMTLKKGSYSNQRWLCRWWTRLIYYDNIFEKLKTLWRNGQTFIQWWFSEFQVEELVILNISPTWEIVCFGKISPEIYQTIQDLGVSRLGFLSPSITVYFGESTWCFECFRTEALGKQQDSYCGLLGTQDQTQSFLSKVIVDIINNIDKILRHRAILLVLVT